MTRISAFFAVFHNNSPCEDRLDVFDFSSMSLAIIYSGCRKVFFVLRGLADVFERLASCLRCTQ